MWEVGPNGVEGFEWFIVVLAFVVDLSSYAASDRQRRAGFDPIDQPARRWRSLAA